MPYIKKTYIAGKSIEIRKCYSGRYGKSIPRRSNHSATPDDVREVNRQNAIRRLKLLLNANFTGGDLHVTFTTRKEDEPADEDECRARFRKLCQKLRLAYKKQGKAFKYIGVPSFYRKHFHVHMVIEKQELQIIQECWAYGKIYISPLDNSGCYGKLAEYLLHHEKNIYKKSWCASTKLAQPVIITEIINSGKWKPEPKIPKGFYLLKDSRDINGYDLFGRPIQNYTIVRLQI